MHIRSPDAFRAVSYPSAPRSLRAVPPKFQGALTALLRGRDGNVYLFNGQRCFDQSLEREYAIGAAFGLVRNVVFDESRVDAALRGQDGVFYLFAGDQFLSYTPSAEKPRELPELSDRLPAAIADRFGGLEHVRHAFVRDGITYLIEAPNEVGEFRYVRYSSADYSRPDNAQPLVGDFLFWNLPSEFVDRGFDRIDVVLAEGEGDLLFVCGREFVLYDGGTQSWTPPRPLAVRWAELAKRDPDFSSINAIFRAPDESTWIFSNNSCVNLDGPSPIVRAHINVRWGRFDNRFTLANRIDTACVFGEFTFLFAGDQYVRYSGTNYSFVDAGYPRRITGEMRKEPIFQHLPAELEHRFTLLDREAVWIECAFTTGGVCYLQIAGQAFAVSAQVSRSFPLARLGRMRNELVRRAKVDAAFSLGDQLFLLSGDQYVRYSNANLDFVDDGYPQTIDERLLGELAPAPTVSLPGQFHFDLDAAVLTDGVLYLFRRREFVRFDTRQGAGELKVEAIKDVFGRVQNAFLPTPHDPSPRIDAAFVAADGALYVFKGEQHLRYSDPDATTVDEGYPCLIRDRWGDLPGMFEKQIDVAFVLDGRSYLGRGEHYARFGNSSHRRVDSVQPQSFVACFRAANDFQLQDLRLIQRFVSLCRLHPAENNGLTDFLLRDPREKADPYALLAALFEWEVGDLQWLKRQDGFLNRPVRSVSSEERFDLELVLRIHETMELSLRLRSHPEELFTRVWLPLYGGAPQRQPDYTVTALGRMLAALYPGDDWKQIERQLTDAHNTTLRDALSAWLVAHIRDPRRLTDRRDLSNLLLTEVEMVASADTSPIVEAIAAVQLFVHRALMGLEGVEFRKGEKGREQFKSRWQWFRNYRVWEANRKVFLYPESYIRPELRDTRTPAFEKLRNDLLQGEIDNLSVTRAFRKYIDDFAEVSSLAIAGGYVRSPGDDTELILFGRTRSEPRRFYFRTARFPQGSMVNADWRAWQPMGVEIAAERVHPVWAFGRIFVFWYELDQKTNSNSPVTMTRTPVENSAGTEKISNSGAVTHRIRIRYTLQDLNGEWKAPQELKPKEDLLQSRFSIEDVKLQVRLARHGGGRSHGDIVVSCNWRVDEAEMDALLVELRLKRQLKLLEYSIFSQLVFVPLVKESLAPGSRAELDRIDADIRQLESQRTTSRAAFSMSSDFETQSLFPGSRSDAPIVTIQSGESSFGTSFEGPLLVTTPQDGTPFVIAMDTDVDDMRGTWFSIDYKGGSFLCKAPQQARNPEQNMRLLAENPLGFPKWDKIDAAFGWGGVFHFFRGLSCAELDGSDLLEYDLRERWGHIETTIARDGHIDAAWQNGTELYLARGEECLVFSSSAARYAQRRLPVGKALAVDSETLNWKSVDAVLATDERRVIFRNTLFVDSNFPNKPQSIRSRWGRCQNGFNDPRTPESVIGAFVLGNRTFIIGERSYLRYTDEEYVMCDEGYPREQTLGTLLKEFTQVFAQEFGDKIDLTELERPLMLAQSLGDDVWQLSIDGVTFTVTKSTKDLKIKPEKGRIPPVQFKFESKAFTFKAEASEENTSKRKSKTEKQPARVSAALVGLDNRLYLFAGPKYSIIELSKEFNTEVLSTAPLRESLTPVGDFWGIEPNNLTRPESSVDAAFFVGEQIFLISGDEYFRYSDIDQRFVDRGYPKPLISGSDDDGLPNWGTIDAAITVGETTTFLGRVVIDGKSEGQSAWADGSGAESIASRWGLPGNRILEHGVDGACRQDGAIFLFSGKEYVRYTPVDGHIQRFMDSGYPRSIAVAAGSPANDTSAWERGVTCGWSRNGITYLFRGAGYDRIGTLNDSDEPSMLLRAKARPIRGNWHNLPGVFAMGIDAALSDGEQLVLFRGNQYLHIDLNTDDPQPYEAEMALYDLVRLTSSTVAELSARLFEGGVAELMSLDTQSIDESPTFLKVSSEIPRSSTAVMPSRGMEIQNSSNELNGGEKTIRVNAARVGRKPVSGHLDFSGANGIYYWEIFFHAPFLIARALNAAQRFADARTWYEYTFDPTSPDGAWRFLPFLASDVEQLVVRVRSILKRGQWNGTPAADQFKRYIDLLTEMDAAFQGESELDRNLFSEFNSDDLSRLRETVVSLSGDDQLENELLELVGLMEELPDRWNDLQSTRATQIDTYLDDPFDPHAIAALRPIAYRKALVMSYLDNLLDWGDMLFGQYTRESINEARILYLQTLDILGRRPESGGHRLLSVGSDYEGLSGPRGREYDFLLTLEDRPSSLAHARVRDWSPAQTDASVRDPYFFIPPNDDLIAHWTRVEDRLYKIRHCLNLQGVHQPLALFAPPIDPMALVNAVASGADVGSGNDVSGAADVPIYRCAGLLDRAQVLADKVSQLGSELLGTLEKQDAEELARLQTKNEREIFELTIEMHSSELLEAKANRLALDSGKKSAEARRDTYASWIQAGLLQGEQVQQDLLKSAAALQVTAAVLQAVRGVCGFIPTAKLGPFIIGAESQPAGTPVEAFAEMANSTATGLQTVGEIMGLTAQHERSMHEWKLQKAMAEHDVAQIELQCKAADHRIEVVQRQMNNVVKQVEHNKSVTQFYRSKFTNQELYEWMAGQLSSIHYQTYQLALSMARAAERAFQFERGRPERDTQFIHGQYWDNRRKGLTAGAQLTLDLARMESAFVATDSRRFEITKSISLLELDPRAFLDFKANGMCEFELGEALFDYDFPGHYCRQVKSIAVKIDLGEGVSANATLTQLTNRVVMEPDAKAVAFLLDPRESPPISLRQNWQASQQIALSHVDEGERYDGMFAGMRVDGERYFPFEGTGAVSRWRLELCGRPGSVDLRALTVVTIKLEYTALAGGDVFAAAVRGLLKPVDAVRAFDVRTDFAEAWTTFLEGEGQTLNLEFRPSHFPSMASGRIRAVFVRYETTAPGTAEFILDLGEPVKLPDGKTVETNGLTIRNTGTHMRLKVRGDKSTMTNVYLLLSYKAGVR